MEGPDQASLTLRAVPAPATGMTVTLTTGGTATRDTDYTLSSTTITLAAGETAGTVTLTVTDDAEDNEATPVPALPRHGVLWLGLLLTVLGAAGLRLRDRPRTDHARVPARW